MRSAVSVAPSAVAVAVAVRMEVSGGRPHRTDPGSRGDEVFGGGLFGSESMAPQLTRWCGGAKQSGGVQYAKKRLGVCRWGRRGVGAWARGWSPHALSRREKSPTDARRWRESTLAVKMEKARVRIVQ